jgi:hypothetical protein
VHSGLYSEFVRGLVVAIGCIVDNEKIKKITTESNPFEKIINLHGNDNIDMDSTKAESVNACR